MLQLVTTTQHFLQVGDPPHIPKLMCVCLTLPSWNLKGVHNMDMCVKNQKMGVCGSQSPCLFVWRPFDSELHLANRSSSADF
jgi:hypothetical protein